jgi:transglutaminase superfamily protein
MKYCLVSVLLLFSGTVFSQGKTAYNSIDSISKTVKYQGNIKKLSYELTKNYDLQMDKARAIFIWITDNISYDCRGYNNRKQPKPIKCKDPDDCKAKIAKQQEDYLNRVITKKKGICEGYARLFKTMCGYSGIPCSVVSGYTKNHPSQIGKMGPLDHAWNFMLIDGQYYWLDATWAAGGCTRNLKTGKLKKFIKSFDDYYWLTPIEKFSRNHFPKDTTLLASAPITKKQYKNAAYVPGYKLETIEVLEPDSGILNACLGDTIRFSIRNSAVNETKKIQVNTNVKHKPISKKDGTAENEDAQQQFYIPFERKDDLYHFAYVADNVKTRYLDIHFNGSFVARFKIKVSE